MSCFQVVFNEDGTATLLGRVTDEDANAGGVATGVDGEGRFLQIADVSTITCNVYDLESATPETAVITPTVTVATSILDTVVTDNEIWTIDSVGYNFKHTLPVTAFPTGGHTYLVEYKLTTAAGTVGFGRYKGPALEAHGS